MPFARGNIDKIRPIGRIADLAVLVAYGRLVGPGKDFVSARQDANGYRVRVVGVGVLRQLGDAASVNDDVVASFLGRRRELRDKLRRAAVVRQDTRLGPRRYERNIVRRNLRPGLVGVVAVYLERPALESLRDA